MSGAVLLQRDQQARFAEAVARIDGGAFAQCARDASRIVVARRRMSRRALVASSASVDRAGRRPRKRAARPTVRALTPSRPMLRTQSTLRRPSGSIDVVPCSPMPSLEALRARFALHKQRRLQVAGKRTITAFAEAYNVPAQRRFRRPDRTRLRGDAHDRTQQEAHRASRASRAALRCRRLPSAQETGTARHDGGEADVEQARPGHAVDARRRRRAMRRTGSTPTAATRRRAITPARRSTRATSTSCGRRSCSRPPCWSRWRPRRSSSTA